MTELIPSDSIVIIPTYNEKDNVKNMIENLFSLYPHLSILIVDDSSPDGTSDIVNLLQNSFPHLFLLKRAGKLGFASAYLDGFAWCLERNFNFIAQIDCDFSHNPHDLLHLFKTCEQGADIAIGSRYIGGIRVINWPMRRLLLSYCASFFIRFMTGLTLHDPTAGFKCFKSSALKKILSHKIYSQGYFFQVETNNIAHLLSLKTIEVPIIFREREEGVSKMSFKIIKEAFCLTLRLSLHRLKIKS
ncbi:MAG: polyprenol monophosphomannose synthase [Bacteriovoracaceae bacterium]|nr:polyprenol monophosphomannose synthase [Bacteriovoracaceae bacterium]